MSIFRCSEIKKIDSHAHVRWPGDRLVLPIIRDIIYPTTSELLDLYDKLSIEKGILLPIISPEAQYTLLSNESVYKIVCEHPDRFYWACNIDPRQGNNDSETNFSDLLCKYIEYGAKGLGEITCNMYIDDSKAVNLFYHCAKMHLPVTAHISDKLGSGYGLVDDIGLPRLDKLLTKLPDLIFVGHAQCFWREITSFSANDSSYPNGPIEQEGNLQSLLRKHKNLFCDLSARSGSNALLRDTMYAYQFIDEFQNQLLLGFDVCNVKDPLYSEKVAFFNNGYEHGYISDEAYRKIVMLNANKIYKLDI